jgi:hypothetical protein
VAIEHFWIVVAKELAQLLGDGFRLGRRRGSAIVSDEQNLIGGAKVELCDGLPLMSCALRLRRAFCTLSIRATRHRTKRRESENSFCGSPTP